MAASKTSANTADNTPVGQFSHAHVGIVMQLDRMSALPALLAPARMAKETAQRALDFFRDAVYEHHETEERELFPAVLASASKGEEKEKVICLIEALTADHREIEGLWKRVEPALKKIAKGQSFDLDSRVLEEMIARYQQHAQTEETQFLPLSETILGRNSNHMAALGMSLHLRHQPIRVGHI